MFAKQTACIAWPHCGTKTLGIIGIAMSLHPSQSDKSSSRGFEHQEQVVPPSLRKSNLYISAISSLKSLWHLKCSKLAKVRASGSSYSPSIAAASAGLAVSKMMATRTADTRKGATTSSNSSMSKMVALILRHADESRMSVSWAWAASIGPLNNTSLILARSSKKVYAHHRGRIRRRQKVDSCSFVCRRNLSSSSLAASSTWLTRCSRNTCTARALWPFHGGTSLESGGVQ
mmetsp:Transcript_32770/g.76874  ORF Transcript_32770/g.76874 Transcript_32770/m.76874 type:complete len:231 (+) Transcript_32770:725-1417(+)